MRVAVTGGSGYIGTALLRRVRAQGHDGFAVRRGRREDASATWDPATGWVRPGMFDGVDAVVHLSGTSIGAKRWTASRRAALRSSRIDSARVLVEHLRTLERPPRVLVTASAAGYYGDTGEREVREDAPQGSGFLAELVADWEREVARASEFGVRTVFARFGPMIARDSELIERVLLPFRLGVGGRLGSGKQWFSWVATEDAVSALVFLLEHEGLSGPVNVVAPEPATNVRFTRALGLALHRPTVFPVPTLALRTLFGRALADEVLLVSQRVYPGRLLDAGFGFRHSTIEEALQAAFGKPGTSTRAGAVQ